jgi:uncharacterized damage-inducible protein DinB
MESTDIAAHFLQDALRQLRKYRELARRALAQLPDEHFFAAPDAETNSVALILKHMGGNMRSRWTDFLSSDGEKPDRQRDREFVREESDSRASVLRSWEEGWEAALAALEALRPDDLARTVTIRGEPHSVLEAINRQLTHYAYHVGQVVLLVRTHVGEEWRSLSIPRGASERLEVSREGEARDASSRP